MERMGIESASVSNRTDVYLWTEIGDGSLERIIGYRGWPHDPWVAVESGRAFCVSRSAPVFAFADDSERAAFLADRRRASRERRDEMAREMPYGC